MWSNNNVVLVLATLALCLVALAPNPTEALSCIPCHTRTCVAPPACEHGLVKDKCGCCTVCGTGPGERCWTFGTACAPGLECVYGREVRDGIEFRSQSGKCTAKGQ